MFKLKDKSFMVEFERPEHSISLESREKKIHRKKATLY